MPPPHFFAKRQHVTSKLPKMHHLGSDGWTDERVLRHFRQRKALQTGRDHGIEVNGTCGQDETSV